MRPLALSCNVRSQRSQHKNRAEAWNMLRARLYENELRKREEAAQAAASSKTDIGWGHQIRSYVLQPYQMVKDLRTGVESPTPAHGSGWRSGRVYVSRAGRARRGRQQRCQGSGLGPAYCTLQPVATRARSAVIIISISPSSFTSGVHPSLLRALSGRPTNSSTSAGRKNFGLT